MKRDYAYKLLWLKKWKHSFKAYEEIAETAREMLGENHLVRQRAEQEYREKVKLYSR